MLSKDYDINIFTITKLREEHSKYFKLYNESKYEVHANTSGIMRGVLIMSKKSIPLKMQVIERTACGNLLMSTITHDNQDILIVADDRPDFYVSIKIKMECSPIQHKLLLGDLILMLDPRWETFFYVGTNNNNEAREEVIKIRDELEMIDPAETTKYRKPHYLYQRQRTKRSKIR